MNLHLKMIEEGLLLAVANSFTLFFKLQNELHEAIDELDEKHDKPLNLKIFRDLLEVSKRIDYDLNTPYGAELSHKTILHLALEEEDGLPYVEELLLVTLNRNN